jgi:tetratricopeptide (TPR) repeat protein
MKNFKFLVVTIVLMAATMPANAQKWGTTPEDSIDCIANTSVYREMYKQKDYIGAYDSWHRVVAKCPQSSKNLYICGATILKMKINAAKTAEEKDAYIKELMDLYDTRIKYFGEVGDNLGRKAYDLEQLKGTKAVAEYYPIYQEAIRQGGDKIDPDYAYKFFDATLTYVKAGLGDATLVIDAYDQVSDLLDKAMRDEPAKAEETGKYMAAVENGFAPYATCDQLVSIYSKKFQENPNDVDLLKKITNIMRKKGCTDQDLFFKASEKLHELEPSPNTAFLMAQMCYNKKKYSEAVKYSNEAISGMTDENDKYKSYILLGMAYNGLDNYGAARNAYRNAADVQPSNGEPYLMIAQLYGGSARSVSDGMGGASAFWAAVDKCVRAKNVDSSPKTVETANRLIGIYSSHFPKQETAFMLDLIDGHSFTVPGWIGESTTIRTRK